MLSQGEHEKGGLASFASSINYDLCECNKITEICSKEMMMGELLVGGVISVEGSKMLFCLRQCD